MAAAVGVAAASRGRKVLRRQKSEVRSSEAAGVRTKAPVADPAARPRVGIFPPSDPVLADPTRYGQGLYSHVDWCGAFQDATPYGWAELEVEGSVPSDLRGTLYRNGPGRFQRGGVPYAHFLDGDGFVSAWELKDGRCRYRGDFVRTEEFKAEDEVDKVLFRSSMGTAKEGGPLANVFDLKLKNVANTNVLTWGGKLLALYEADLPLRLSDSDLDCQGSEDMAGVLRSGTPASVGNDVVDRALGLGGDAFTAHPKMDPASRTMVGFSWKSLNGVGMQLQFHEWDEDFKPVGGQKKEILIPKCDAQPHDFGLTPTQCVFIENRLKLEGLHDFVLGIRGPAQCILAEPEVPQRIHLISRLDGRTVSIDGSCSAFDVHVAHCHDGPPVGWTGTEPELQGAKPGDLVTIYSSSWDQLPPGPFLSSWTSKDESWPFEVPPISQTAADFNLVERARLQRHVIDHQRGVVLDRRVVPGCEELCMEHPTINCSWTGNPDARFVYLVVCNECGLSTPPCGWGKVDMKTGEIKRWYAGSRAVTEEPHFVPRRGPRGTWTPGLPEGAEDDGWLLGVMYDAARDQSCLCVLDAAKVEAGPVCRIWLPHPVPHGLHGCFEPAKV